MNLYQVTIKQTKGRHFCAPGEIVRATGYEWRENDILFLEVITEKNLKQFVPQMELKRIFSSAQQNEILTNKFYYASY
jgi:hypothetical protein